MPIAKDNFSAPRVPEANEDGGLPSQPAEGDAYKVYITVWPDAKPGDKYRLLKRGSPFNSEPSTAGTLQNEEPGSEVVLLLPRILFAAGPIHLGFDVYRNNEFLHGSDSRRLYIIQ